MKIKKIGEILCEWKEVNISKADVCPLCTYSGRDIVENKYIKFYKQKQYNMIATFS